MTSPLHGLPLRQVPWTVLDVETTGLSPAQGDRIIELALLRREPDGRRQLFSQLVNPGRPIEPRASAVNGIRDADVAGAPPFADLVGPLAELLEGAVLVAHNASFDLGFLGAELQRLGLPPPQQPVVDTLGLARQCFRFPANNLGVVAAALGVRAGTAHRAGGDVTTTLGVLEAMLERLEAAGVKTVGETIVAAKLGIGPTESPPADMPEPLRTAIAERRDLMIRYRSRGRALTVRRIRPIALRGGHLVAYCHLRREERTFSIERIALAWWP